jgi:hypothetical protein
MMLAEWIMIGFVGGNVLPGPLFTLYVRTCSKT